MRQRNGRGPDLGRGEGRGGREGSRTGRNVDEDVGDLGDGAGGALGVHQHPSDHRLHEPELEVWARERRVRHIRFLVHRAVEVLGGRRLVADGDEHAPPGVFRGIRHRGVRLVQGWSCARLRVAAPLRSPHRKGKPGCQ